LGIGHTVLDWNELQERLGRLFQRLIGGDYHVGMAIWYSQVSDKAQREMLKAAAIKAPAEVISQEEADDIKWALHKADGLAEERNNITHAHYQDWLSFSPESFLQVRTAPAPTGSSRTEKLHKRPDIAAHFSEKTKSLSETVAKMHNAIYYGRQEHPWPGKPPLPVQH
jgi:hypothetical protein